MLQPESPSTSETKQQIFDHYLYRLQSEIHTILSAESDNEDRYKRLETDLDVFKRACFAAENDKRALNDEIRALKLALESSEAQRGSMEKRIVCIIDADDSVFAVDLLIKAKEGGRIAAKQLAESIHYHLGSDQPCHLWTYVYFNRRRLLEAISAARGARDMLDDFVAGFNQSNERFIMADLGGEDGVVTSKVRASLDFHARSQETYRVVFGGCNSDTYLHQLHSLHLTSVYREKLVLLPAFTDMTPEINNLQLPSLVIPGLFTSDKLDDLKERFIGPSEANVVGSRSRTLAFGSSDPHSQSVTSEESSSRASSSGSLTPPPPPYPDQDQTESLEKVNVSNIQSPPITPTSSTSERQKRVVLGHASGPVSYHPGLRTRSHSKTLSVDTSDKRSSTKGTDVLGRSGKQRRIIRELPLSQHNPPPCTLFYLASNGCKHGPDCRFGHDYILDDEDYEILRQNAKKVPCPSANRGETCVFGDECCYGHFCPFMTRCHYYKQGKCKFSGESMHRDLVATKN